MTRASVELLEMAEGLRAADRDLTEALRVAEQAVGNLLEKNEEVIAMGTYMGQCMQSLLWQAVQRELDYELVATGSTATAVCTAVTRWTSLCRPSSLLRIGGWRSR